MLNSLIFFYFPQVNCEWGTWSSSTACTKTCGGGKELRFRTILKHGENGGTMCSDGENFEETDCNTASCPPPGEFIRSISIAPIFLLRIFEFEMTRIYFLFYLYLVDCEWGNYSAWTGCTKTCGTGQQYRFRTIKTHDVNGGTACDPNLNVEEQDCNTDSCPTTGKRFPFFFTYSICFIPT